MVDLWKALMAIIIAWHLGLILGYWLEKREHENK